MSEWYESLEGILAQVGATLRAGAGGRGAAMLPVLATVSPEGWPEARTVRLRDCDWPAGVLEVHSDLDTAKIHSQRADPRAALHVWEPELALQIRLGLRLEVLSGAEVAERWEKVPDGSRDAYGKSPAPGTPIEGALDYALLASPESFAVLRGQAERLDAVHLGEDHRRALFTRGGGGWDSRWLVP